MYAAPPVIQTEVFTTLPKELHNTEKYSAWVAERRAGKLHSFLEGPSFDREGNLYCTDIPYGRDRKSTRLNSSHSQQSRMPSSA